MNPVVWNSTFTAMKTIEFTDQERNAIIQLIDIAVKAKGLEISKPAAILASKFMDKPEPEEEGEAEEQEAEYAE